MRLLDRFTRRTVMPYSKLGLQCLSEDFVTSDDRLVSKNVQEARQSYEVPVHIHENLIQTQLKVVTLRYYPILSLGGVDHLLTIKLV